MPKSRILLSARTRAFYKKRIEGDRKMGEEKNKEIITKIFGDLINKAILEKEEEVNERMKPILEPILPLILDSIMDMENEMIKQKGLALLLEQKIIKEDLYEEYIFLPFIEVLAKLLKEIPTIHMGVMIYPFIKIIIENKE